MMSLTNSTAKFVHVYPRRWTERDAIEMFLGRGLLVEVPPPVEGGDVCQALLYRASAQDLRKLRRLEAVIDDDPDPKTLGWFHLLVERGQEGVPVEMGPELACGSGGQLEPECTPPLNCAIRRANSALIPTLRKMPVPRLRPTGILRIRNRIREAIRWGTGWLGPRAELDERLLEDGDLLARERAHRRRRRAASADPSGGKTSGAAVQARLEAETEADMTLRVLDTFRGTVEQFAHWYDAEAAERSTKFGVCFWAGDRGGDAEALRGVRAQLAVLDVDDCEGVDDPEGNGLAGVPTAVLTEILFRLADFGGGWSCPTWSDRPQDDIRRCRIVMPLRRAVGQGVYERVVRGLMHVVRSMLESHGFGPNQIAKILDEASSKVGQPWQVGPSPLVPFGGPQDRLDPRTAPLAPPRPRRRQHTAPPDLMVVCADGAARRLDAVDEGTLFRCPSSDHEDLNPSCRRTRSGYVCMSHPGGRRFWHVTAWHREPEVNPTWTRKPALSVPFLRRDHVMGDGAVLRSPCATGKTTLLIQLLADVLRGGGRMLVVDPRATHRDSLDATLRAAHGLNAHDPRLVVVCPESILGIDDDAPFSLVVIEESETTYAQVLGETCGAFGPAILEALAARCRAADRVVITDAHAGPVTLQTTRDLLGCEPTLVDNAFEHGRVARIRRGGPREVVVRLRELVEGGLTREHGILGALRCADVGRDTPKILVACASAREARILHRWASRRWQHLRVRLVTGAERRRGAVSLRDPDADFAGADIVIYTTVCGVGTDLQSREWDHVLLLAHHCLSVRDHLQLMVRARHPWAPEVDVFLRAHHQAGLSTDQAVLDSELREDLRAAKRWLEDHHRSHYYARTSGVVHMPSRIYHRLLLAWRAQRNAELTDWEAAFVTGVREHRWTAIEHDDAEDPESLKHARQDLRGAAAELDDERVALRRSARTIDDDEAEWLEQAGRGGKSNSEDEDALERHAFEAVYGPCSVGQAGTPTRTEAEEFDLESTRSRDRLRAFSDCCLAERGELPMLEADVDELDSSAPSRCRERTRVSCERLAYLRLWGASPCHDELGPWQHLDDHEDPNRRALSPPRLRDAEILVGASGSAERRAWCRRHGTSAVKAPADSPAMLASVVRLIGLRLLLARKEDEGATRRYRLDDATVGRAWRLSTHLRARTPSQPRANDPPVPCLLEEWTGT